MEKMSVLTHHQKLIFDKINNSDFITSNFYFTGGTALSEFYLQHRYSEDLDFFSEKEFDIQQVRIEISKWATDSGFTYKSQHQGFVHIFILNFNDKTRLKLDFGHYPHKRIVKGIYFQRIAVDSLLDIAVNKFSAFHQRSTSKDLVDLYYLLKKFTIWDLMEGARVKFNLETDPWILSSDLAFAVEKIIGLPRMIKHLSAVQLKNYFRNLAIQLGKKSTL